MKLLLDECVTKRLKSQLWDFEVYTVSELGWNGVKNGKLMTLCVENNFDILLTIDKNMIYQQNIEKYPIAIAVIDSFTSKFEELILFIPFLIKQMLYLEKHKAYIIKRE
jgi:predicted nuclease of predicted toxin-antitoxin system